MERQTIALKYEPREWFIPFHNRTERIAVAVCHRRCGKTYAAIADCVDRALEIPNGRFCFIAPFYRQAKAAAWDYLVDLTKEVQAKAPHETELQVELINESRIRLFGADNPDALRGIGLDGVVFDEFASMRPSIWEVIRPALADRKGWAVFIGTPQGHAGLYDIFNAKNEWKDVEAYRVLLRASDTNALDAEELANMKATLTEDAYAQELECSFEAAIKGSVYGKLLSAAEADDPRRICGVPYDPNALVYTAWDLGIGDPTAIWFAQVVGKEIHVIDYYESSGVDVAHYAALVRSKPYNYGGHYLPHDAEAKELTSGKSAHETLRSLDLENITVLQRHRLEDGINATRLLVPRCWFEAKKCERGIEALKLYRYEFDEKLNTFKNAPVHDWTSHAADAFRYLAMSIDTARKSNFHRPINYPRIGVA